MHVEVLGLCVVTQRIAKMMLVMLILVVLPYKCALLLAKWRCTWMMWACFYS